MAASCFSVGLAAWLQLLQGTCERLLAQRLQPAHVPMLQDKAPMTDKQIHSVCVKHWNVSNKPMLHTWLSQNMLPEHKSRMHALGNCVMPAVCHLATQILGHETARQ